MALAAHRGQKLSGKIARVIFLNIKIAVDVADEDLVRRGIGGNRLRHADRHVGREKRRMLRAGTINNDVGFAQRGCGRRVGFGNAVCAVQQGSPPVGRFGGIFYRGPVKFLVQEEQFADRG